MAAQIACLNQLPRMAADRNSTIPQVSIFIVFYKQQMHVSYSRVVANLPACTCDHLPQVVRVYKSFACRCIHITCSCRDKAQRPSAFMSQPCKRLTSSTPELRAQLNLTNDHKKKERPHLKHVLLPDFSWKKVKPGTAARCSTKRHSTGWKPKNGQLFTLLKRITNSKV